MSPSLKRSNAISEKRLKIQEDLKKLRQSQEELAKKKEMSMKKLETLT